jgi:2-methylcitrate dehydratase PrpD
MRSTQTVAQMLAGFLCELQYEQLPSEIILREKSLLLDQLGCQLLGSTLAWNRPVYDFVREHKSGGPATIVNHGDKAALDDAVLVNGTFGQGCELDDYYDQGGGHPGAASIPVALALSEKYPVTGKEFLTAIAAGYEIGWRVGRALLPELMRRGYHAQGVVGVFIAAATAAKLLRFNPEKMTHALAIAGSHASGTMEYDQSGGEVKRMHNGMACSAGVRSAMVAALGLTGPSTIFEGERGILKVFSGACHTEPLLSSLGSDLAVLHAAIKRFPVNASQHSPIELLESLIKKYDVSPEDVKSIEVGVNEGIILHGGTIFEPTEVIEAQFSLRFSLALRLLKRSNDFQFYLDSKLWSDPGILAVGKKITLVADPSAHKERRFACRMKMILSDERVVEADLPSPKGTTRNPLSKEELTEKFFTMSSAVLPDENLNRIIEKVDNIEAENDMSTLATLLIAERNVDDQSKKES